MYFYYQRNFKRQWVGAMMPEAPNAKSADGVKREIARVVELRDIESQFDIRDLMKIYPPPEDPEPAYVDFAHNPIVTQEVVAVVREYQSNTVQEGMAGR